MFECQNTQLNTKNYNQIQKRKLGSMKKNGRVTEFPGPPNELTKFHDEMK